MKSVHMMMRSKLFKAAALALSSRQSEAVVRKPSPVTLELYQYAIQLLIHRNATEPMLSVLAACTLLWVYEMMASEVEDWRRHLKVVICPRVLVGN
jgi:hypothetical protein